MTKRKIKEACRLLGDFFIIGLFTFGGGWSIIAQMSKKYVEGSNIISGEELVDITSVGRSLPGIMVLNVSMIFGQRVAGYLGGLACLIGIATPPFLVILVVTTLYEHLSKLALLRATMIGVRAAVVPIIVYAAMSMAKSSIKDYPCLIVFVIAFLCNYFFGLSTIAVIVIGGVCGCFISDYYERKGTT